MSHFTVLVIGEDIEEQLEPYAEQGFEPQYSAFEDTEDENLKEYLEKNVDIIVLADGSLHHRYEEQFKHYKKDSYQSEYTYPEGHIIRSGKYTELFATFEEFMEEWHGTSERDEVKERYGYWHNPNARWDWYSIGGRWSGFFKPKAGAVGIVGEPGAFNNKPKSGWVDSLKLKDIDILSMQEHTMKKANEEYDKLEAVLQDRPLPSWTEIREKHGEDIDAARNEYNSLEVVQDLNKAQFWAMDDLVETYGRSREEYVAKCKLQVMVPFAVVKDGEWFEKGKMGWWASVSNEMEQNEWNTKFWELINSLDPDTTLTLLDCHI